MIVKRLVLKNWRNFKKVDVSFGDRVFLVGPNAAGKSNFLEVFRFLRDIARSEGGGLQEAITNAGGMKKIRCLAARGAPDVEIGVYLGQQGNDHSDWSYSIAITEDDKSAGKPRLSAERINCDNELLLPSQLSSKWSRKHGFISIQRPRSDDKADPKRLTETLLEQTSANQDFRVIADFFESVSYLHLVPQLVRHASEFVSPSAIGDPFGLRFLERLAKTDDHKREAFLKRIERALKLAVPYFKQLKYKPDNQGRPHIEVIYSHWRANGARQQEDQFSDGTIRLIGLFWALLEEGGPLLLEEPELSLNDEIVRLIPALMHEVMHGNQRQVFVSTHSYALLSDAGIGLEEVLLLRPGKEGTVIERASELEEARLLVEGGMSVGEVVLPMAAPENAADIQL